MKIKICAIAKDENHYLEEWVNHYLNLGVDEIIIYDNNSAIPINMNNSKVFIKQWLDKDFGSQSRCYLNCCQNNRGCDFIGFFDIDEFYYSKNMDIKKDIKELKDKFGNFEGLGIYWRIYGSNPAFLEKQSKDSYTMWYGDKHIKSFVNPSKVLNFPDPHKAELIGSYIDENGKSIVASTGVHTSSNIWVKHIFTRSLSEFQEKMERGDANTREKNRTLNDFIQYNLKCVNND